MNLPFIKNFQKKVLPSYFLVLVLRDEKVNAVIFEEVEGQIKIIGQKVEHFPNSIDSVSSEEFLQTLDKAISHAESALAKNIQTQKTIFGVKEGWVAFDQIKKEYLSKLKKASQELGLAPIGFLVISQAISHLLAKEEGAPISAILAEVNRKSLTITLVRAGKSIETKSSEIHESIPFTVDTLLKHFNIPEILPSRIIIFNGKEDLSQEFISHTWSKSLPFLHLPQITNLPSGFDAKSVLFGAATQMGFEILAKDIPKEPIGNKESVENPVAEIETYKNIEAEDFGFAKDIDVAKMPAPPKIRLPSRGWEFQDGEPEEELKHIRIGSVQETLPPKKTSGVNNILTLIKSILISVLGVLLLFAKKINIKNILSISTQAPKGKLTIIVLVILMLIIAFIASYFLFLKATIAITVDPKITEKTANIVFSTKEKTDRSKDIIEGKFVSVSEDGSVSTAATGKKDIGTKAKGTVTVFNLSKTSKNLPDGTEIASSNGLIFVLDNAVNLASASSSIDSNFNVTTKPSTVNVNVTASALGKESNLPSGTKFSVASFDTSDLITKNDNPFSGGTKKEVTVVSKSDEAKLQVELPKQLENKAKSDLLKQIGQEKALLPVFISTSLSKKSLNVKVGDETTQVTLTGTVEFQGISYDKNDLISFSKSLLEKDVLETQKVDYNNIKTAVLNIKNENDEEVEANLNIKALLLPKIDETKLTKDLKGKSFKTAEDLLYKLPQVSDIDIYFSPKLLFLPKNLPVREKNIKILINIDG